jgi:hypothetical protein
MKINITTKKAFCYIRAGMLEETKKELTEAENLFRSLESNKNIK